MNNSSVRVINIKVKKRQERTKSEKKLTIKPRGQFLMDSQEKLRKKQIQDVKVVKIKRNEEESEVSDADPEDFDERRNSNANVYAKQSAVNSHRAKSEGSTGGFNNFFKP